VLRLLKSLFDNPEREAKRLNRDAAVIVDSATKSMAAARVRETAVMTLEHIVETRAHLDEHTDGLDQLLSRFRQLHSEARRRMDQVSLTAYTLVIIYLRASALGERADPALHIIDEFTGEWSHAVEQ